MRPSRLSWVIQPRSSLLGHPQFLICFGLALGYVTLFMILPYARIFQFSFWRVDGYTVAPDFTLDNYAKAINTPLYSTVLLNSLEIALIVTLCTVVLGYVLAAFLAFVAVRHRHLLLLLVNVPIWTSFLLRAFIWKIILGRSGIINGVLLELGFIEQPLSIFLYNRFSVCLSLIYIFIPFMALPIYAALERLPPGSVEASLDLGASPWTTFRRIVLPLSLPGVAAGATFVFCLSFGDFVTPTLLGGPDGIMIANVIIGQFGAAFDWPFGSALAVVVLAVTLGVLLLAIRLQGRSAQHVA
jgi:spermidine/putrescine transport system permease protein